MSALGVLLVAICTQAGTSQASEVTATIHLPSAFDRTAVCLPTDSNCEKMVLNRHHRCLYLQDPDLAQSASEGTFGYTIRIPSGMRGHRFTLASAPANSVDFDVLFYEDLGTCQDDPEPDTDFVGQRYRFAHFGTGVETGIIPGPLSGDGETTTGAHFAIVTLWGAKDAAFKFSVS